MNVAWHGLGSKMTASALFPSVSPGTIVFVAILTAAYFGISVFLSYRYVGTFENRLKAVSIFGAIYLAVLAGWKFLDQRQREVESAFAEKQLALCIDAGEVAATIATSYYNDAALSPDAFQKARLRFIQLYFGSLAIVEDDEVANAMIKFRNEAIAPPAKASTGSADATSADALNHREALYNAALDLADACRAMLKVHWQIELLPQDTKAKRTENTKEIPARADDTTTSLKHTP
jgi:hypothetical protein